MLYLLFLTLANLLGLARLIFLLTSSPQKGQFQKRGYSPRIGIALALGQTFNS